MPDVIQKVLLDDVTTDGNGPAVDIRNMTAYSVYASSTGGTGASIAFEGTADPAGTGGWAALAYREAGGGAYATTADAVTAGNGYSYYFDPSDNVNYIRAVVSSQVGPTTLRAVLTGEV